MILHNFNYTIDKINDVRRVYFASYQPPTLTVSFMPADYAYSSTLVNDKLYLDIKYQRKVDFNNTTTLDTNPYNYNRYNGCLVFDTDNLSHLNISTYHFEHPSISSSIELYNLNKKSDISGNTYHFGYTIGDSVFNVGALIKFTSPNVTLSGISTLYRGKSQYYGHIFKINDSYQIYNVLNFVSDPNLSYGRVIVNDLVNADDYNYVFITSDKTFLDSNYYYYPDNDFLTDTKRLCSGDTYNTMNTCSIVKFNNDFTTDVWYKKYYAVTELSPNNWVNDKNILTTVYKNEKSFNIIEDFDKQYMYNSVRVDIGSDALFTTNGNSNVLLTELNSTYYSFVISKFKMIDGSNIWAKPIYYTSSSNYNFITKMICSNDNIYLTIRTNGAIIVDDVTYNSSNNWNIFIIKIDKDGNFKWVKEFGQNNDDYVTDIIIYNGVFGEYLYLSGYYSNSTKIGSYNLITTGIGTYIAKINIINGEVIGIFEKHSTISVKIKSLSVLNNSLFVCGDFKGGCYFGGNKPKNYKTSTQDEIFVEEIKINSF